MLFIKLCFFGSPLLATPSFLVHSVQRIHGEFQIAMSFHFPKQINWPFICASFYLEFLAENSSSVEFFPALTKICPHNLHCRLNWIDGYFFIVLVIKIHIMRRRFPLHSGRHLRLLCDFCSNSTMVPQCLKHTNDPTNAMPQEAQPKVVCRSCPLHFSPEMYILFTTFGVVSLRWLSVSAQFERRVQ